MTKIKILEQKSALNSSIVSENDRTPNPKTPVPSEFSEIIDTICPIDISYDQLIDICQEKEFWLLPLDANKSPYIPNWNKEKIDYEYLRQELKTGAAKAIGLVTGEVSDDIICLDFDGVDEEFAKKHIFTEQIPPTVIITSGKKGHFSLLFKVKTPTTRTVFQNTLKTRKVVKLDIPSISKTDRKAEIEIRWNKHQCVIWGAHPDTGEYKTRGDNYFHNSEIAELPFWLYDRILNFSNKKEVNKKLVQSLPKTGGENIDETDDIYNTCFDEAGLLIVNDVKDHRFIEFDVDDYESLILKEKLVRLLEIKTALEVLDTDICEDYDSWLNIGMALHHEGTTNGNSDFFDGMRELFHAWSQGSDKYEEEVTEVKWNSFSDRDDSITINTLFHHAHQKVTNVEKLTREIYPLVNNYYTALQLNPKSTIEETSSDIRNLSTANSPISFVGKAYIDKGIHFDTSDSKETIVRIYNPEEGIWEKQNLKSFYADAEYRLNACMKNSYGTIKPLSVKQQKELNAYINVYTKSDPNYIGHKWKSEQSGNIIAFKNKILNLKTKQEEEFRKELYLENKLEREYRPEDGTDCPNWIKLISDLTGNDKKVMDVLEAAALLTLTGRGDTERSFITLYSEDGGAGKGTFMRTLQGLAGKDRSKTASFDRLSDGNLVTSFENKTLIVFPEERNQLYPNSNAYASLLKLTSKDRIDARGNYQTGIEFQSNAMLFVATNKPLFGNDGGMNRRILQIVCPKKENLIPDRSFGKKLEKEYSQITNRLLNKFDFDADNARDLLEEAPDYEAFSNNARMMANEISNVSQFLEEMVVAVCPINRDRGLKASEFKTNPKEYVKNPAPFVNITTLYDAFKIYSTDVNPGSRIMKKINFIKEVKAHYKLNMGADFTLEELKELRVQGDTRRAARFLGLIASEEVLNNILFAPLKSKW